MPFRLASHDAETIVLKREPYSFLKILAALIGLAMVVIVSINDWPESSTLFPAFFATIIGLSLSIAGFLVAPVIYRSQPRYLRFNNTRGVMEVEMSDGKRGFIPYSEIDRITADSGGDVDSDNHGVYSMYLHKKDSGRWSLFSSSRLNEHKEHLRC